MKYGNRLRGIRASGLRISYIWILGKIRNREDAEASSIFGTPEGTRLHLLPMGADRGSPPSKNSGMIATGNHFNLDSLRGAPPSAATVHRTVAFNSSSPFHSKKKSRYPKRDICFSGTPEGTRTPDLLVRSQSLYPTELPAHTTHLSCAQV